MIATTQPRLTFEEYLTYEDGSDFRAEWVAGQLQPMTPPTRQHGRIGFFLARYLAQMPVARDWEIGFGDVGVRTQAERVRLPDLCVMTRAQGERLAQRAAVLDTPPILVVEVVSPESIRRDYRTKRTEYAALGIPEYWIVDPLAGKVSVLVLEDGFYDLAEFSGSDPLISRVFPEIGLTVTTLLTAGAA